jgi:PqqD family protein of HPr-rel-A system
VPASGAVWQVRERFLRWRCWEDEYVIFHAGSGDTHLLDRTAGQALVCLRESPARAAELTRRVAEALGLEPDPGLQEAMSTLLMRLDRLGLIERVER